MIADCSKFDTDVQARQTSLPMTLQGCTCPEWQRRFLVLLPNIRRHANRRFRNFAPELREELVQETIARALLDYLRLVERGKEHVAFAGTLARFAISHVRQGRRVGGRLNSRDVSSEYCRARKGVSLESLDRCDNATGDWQQIVVEDRNSTPAEIASIRIDVHEWLKSLPKRDRTLAERLATGETTSGAARMFGITAGRISQLRRSLEASWLAFQHESASLASR
jgi:DNA-directed RNA polymerase specialized sigma24 family protein